MINKNSLNDYNTYDSKESSTHNRKCIDGSTTGCNNCIAYCEYEGHPGFLTESLKAKHNCEEKKCKYYLPKPRNVNRINMKDRDNEIKNIATIASTATSSMEGLRVMRATKSEGGSWVIYYVTIAGYSLDSVELEMEQHLGEKVEFAKLEYSFEIATALVFGMKMSA